MDMSLRWPYQDEHALPMEPNDQWAGHNCMNNFPTDGVIPSPQSMATTEGLPAAEARHLLSTRASSLVPVRHFPVGGSLAFSAAPSITARGLPVPSIPDYGTGSEPPAFSNVPVSTSYPGAMIPSTELKLPHHWPPQYGNVSPSMYAGCVRIASRRIAPLPRGHVTDPLYSRNDHLATVRISRLATRQSGSSVGVRFSGSLDGPNLYSPVGSSSSRAPIQQTHSIDLSSQTHVQAAPTFSTHPGAIVSQETGSYSYGLFDAGHDSFPTPSQALHFTPQAGLTPQSQQLVSYDNHGSQEPQDDPLSMAYAVSHPHSVPSIQAMQAPQYGHNAVTVSADASAHHENFMRGTTTLSQDHPVSASSTAPFIYDSLGQHPAYLPTANCSMVYNQPSFMPPAPYMQGIHSGMDVLDTHAAHYAPDVPGVAHPLQHTWTTPDMHIPGAHPNMTAAPPYTTYTAPDSTSPICPSAASASSSQTLVPAADAASDPLPAAATSILKRSSDGGPSSLRLPPTKRLNHSDAQGEVIVPVITASRKVKGIDFVASVWSSPRSTHMQQLDRALYPNRLTHNVEAHSALTPIPECWTRTWVRPATQAVAECASTSAPAPKKRRATRTSTRTITDDACINGHRGCDAALDLRHDFIRYHKIHPRPGRAGYIAYRHGVVVYPATVASEQPIVYFPFDRCSRCEKYSQWTYYDFENHTKHLVYTEVEQLPSFQPGWFVETTRAPGLPLIRKEFQATAEGIVVKVFFD